MATHARLRGWMTALVTPFKDGALDEEAFRALVDWQIASGIQGLVPVGTTGESPTLSHDEHKRVVEMAIAESRGRVPVIAGAGSNNTAEAIDLAIHAEKAGADAVLVVTPYYNKPNQEGLFRHFQAIDQKIGIPIVIYNIPPRSVIDMSVDTMKRCYGELRNIVGVKDATGNIGRISTQRAAMGPDFLQFSGDDLTALATFAAGAVGCVSVVSNVAPAPCVALYEAAAKGDFAQALKIQDSLVPLHLATFLEAGVTGAKTGLALQNRAREEVRLPLVSSTDKTREAIRAALIHAGVLAA